MKPELQTLATLSRAYLSAMSCTKYRDWVNLHLVKPNIVERVPEDYPWFGAQNDDELVGMIQEAAVGEKIPFQDLIGTPEYNQHKALHGLLCVMYFG